ncbi:MAG TPA: YqgE/AlgH family protein [Planctomycetota bacterium]|nr:YqgE/AlgH family protein [Planctomycetota bacterium]
MNSLKGKLLIAAPGLRDPNFVRSVVLVAEHDEKGALGIVLNRPGKIAVTDLWAAISSETSTSATHAFMGGPVQENAVLLLHGHADLAPLVEPVVPGVYLASDVEVLGVLLEREAKAAEGGGAPEVKFRVYCGYSGWGAGQLEGEMSAGGWVIYPAEADHVFNAAPEQLWSLVMKALGGVHEFFALMPPDPEMN